MKAISYEGHFNNGRFYTSGKAMHIPEQRRVIITILDDIKVDDSDRQEAWDDFKRMVKETAHENDLLMNDAFNRRESGRDLIDLADGADML